VARSLAPYAGQLFGVGSNFGTFEWNGYTVDFVAAGLVLVVGIMLCFSQGGSSWFNVGEPPAAVRVDIQRVCPCLCS
jgi:hypothetical protein